MVNNLEIIHPVACVGNYRGATVFPDNVQRGPEPEVVELGLNAIVKLSILGHTFYLMKPPSA